MVTCVTYALVTCGFCGERERTTVNFFIFFFNLSATPTNLAPG